MGVDRRSTGKTIEQGHAYRGGSYFNESKYSGCFRSGMDIKYTAPDIGFRVILYIK